MAKLNLSPPWIIFYNQLKAFFRYDPQVKIIYDEDKSDIKLYVTDEEKANALYQLLPMQKTFGNVVLNVTVVSPNGVVKDAELLSKMELYRKALNDNQIVAYFHQTELFAEDILYIVFNKEVVQFFTDDLGDLHGIRSTLYQDLAANIFQPLEGIFFCTDIDGVCLEDLWTMWP